MHGAAHRVARGSCGLASAALRRCRGWTSPPWACWHYVRQQGWAVSDPAEFLRACGSEFDGQEKAASSKRSTGLTNWQPHVVLPSEVWCTAAAQSAATEGCGAFPISAAAASADASWVHEKISSVDMGSHLLRGESPLRSVREGACWEAGPSQRPAVQDGGGYWCVCGRATIDASLGSRGVSREVGDRPGAVLVR